MGSNPINLALRFLLELCAFASASIWGWKFTDGGLRFVLAIGTPVLLAVIWGTFAVPNDPSRSGKTLIVTSGVARLVIEFSFFAFTTWALYDIGLEKIGLIFGIIVILHYLISYDRIFWLLSKKQN